MPLRLQSARGVNARMVSLHVGTQLLKSEVTTVHTTHTMCHRGEYDKRTGSINSLRSKYTPTEHLMGLCADRGTIQSLRLEEELNVATQPDRVRCTDLKTFITHTATMAIVGTVAEYVSKAVWDP